MISGKLIVKYQPGGYNFSQESQDWLHFDAENMIFHGLLMMNGGEKSNKLSEEDRFQAMLLAIGFVLSSPDATLQPLHIPGYFALVYMEPSKDVQVDAEGKDMQKHSLACWFDPMSVEVNNMWPWSIYADSTFVLTWTYWNLGYW